MWTRLSSLFRRQWRPLFALLALAVTATLLWAPFPSAPTPETVPYSTLLDEAAAGKLESVTVDDDARTATATRTDGSEIVTPYPAMGGSDLADALTEAGVEVTVTERPAPSPWWMGMATMLLPFALIFLILWWFMRGRGAGAISGFAKGRGEAAEVPQVTFDDVAGIDEVVDELRDLVTFLKDPGAYAQTGATAPRGVLLEGNPGTGKTLVAKAVAGEAGVPFYAMSGSEFVEVYAGVGSSRVRKLFEAARKHERAIIFIDEIDAVGRSRAGGAQSGGAMEMENTLNQLLVEMDGFTDSSVVVLAATNRADLLDAALLRPGRFDRRITVPLPDRRGRARILAVHTRQKTLGDSVDLDVLAAQTPGMSGADLANLVNQAALVAARAGSTVIDADHLQEALATVAIGRARRGAVVHDRDRAITAWHEAGHALGALLSEHLCDPTQVTVVPRGPAGGVTWVAERDEVFTTASQARARLVMMAAGRAAEEIFLDGDFTQGASSDFQAATNLAANMVCAWGMSSLGVAVRSDTDADDVRAEISAIVEEALSSARRLLNDNRPLLEAVVGELLEQETLDTADLHRIQDRVQGTRDAA